MKHHIVSVVTGLFAACLLLCTTVSAGQVVTDELRQWAKQAIAEEQTLNTESSANSLAVLYFHNQSNNPDWNPLQKGLAVMLITDLAKLPELQVVERAKLQALVEEIGLGTSGLVAQDSAPRVGKLLGARVLVSGDIKQPATSTLGLTGTTLDIPTTSLSTTSDIQGAMEQLFALEKDLLFEIINNLKTITLTPQQEEELKKPLSTSTQALFYYFRGIDLSDQRDYRQAEQYFKKALQADPRLQLAASDLQTVRKVAPAAAARPVESVREQLESIKQSTSLTDTIVAEDQTSNNEKPKSGHLNVQW